jgi:hypothetical protein
MAYGGQGVRKMNSLCLRTVPEHMADELLALWDESAHVPANRMNNPLTHGGRLKWTARNFIARHPGCMWGQGNVHLDLCILLERAERVVRRLQGAGA